MKRSQLKRKPHPDNPYSTFAPRKAGIKRMSTRKREEKAASDPIRDACRDAAGGLCEKCGKRRKLDIHEIPAGSGRHKAVFDANCLLALCRACHEELQGAKFRVQFAWKCRAVANAINRAKGRQILTFANVVCAEDANEAKGF